MPPELARVEKVFADALAKTIPAERADVLNRLCGDDIELRNRVEALLAAHEAAGSFLPLPMETGPSETLGSTETVGAQIGPYSLVQLIGEGGMGEVWVAKQTKPVKREVALKLIKRGMDSKVVLTRFEQERQTLALMDHPSIARIFDGGVTADGRPYFVMELVNGQPLTKFCDEAKLTPRERLALFVTVCQAVQHAHQKGIVHRDLKPSNVLVTLYDAKPVPKVIDFGVAKAMAGKLTDESVSTRFGSVLGTVDYMAPEQAGFSALDVDTRADIYALGVILYELLTGLRPFDNQRIGKAAVDEVFRILREQEPPRPSTRLSSSESLPSLAAMRQTEPKRLTAMMRGELDWVVMKCLEKDRNRRYETANGLARDVQRYLSDEAVEARPPSAGYRLQKVLRRYKGPAITTAAMAVLLILGSAVSTWQAVRATRAEGVAEERREAAEKAEGQASAERYMADKARQRAQQSEARAQHHLYIANMHRIRFELENNNVSAARALLDLYRPGTVAKVRPAWEWYYWDRVCHSELHTLKGHTVRVMDLAYSPDGTVLASAGGDGDAVVKIWDSVTGDELHALHGHEYLISQVAFSSDGKLFATCSSWNGVVKLWDVATWTEVPTWKPESVDEFHCVAFSPNGKTLALSEAKSKRVKFWDLDGQTWAGQFPEGTNSYLIKYSPDGNLIAIATDSGVELWDVNTTTLLRTLTGHSFNDMEQGGYVSEAITGLAFSPDGLLLATCSRDGTAKIRKVLDGKEVRSISVMSAQLQHFSGLTAVAFSPNGKFLVTSGWGIPLKMWEVSTGREVRTFFGQTSSESVAFSPDGTRLASGGGLGGEVKIWDAAGEPGQQMFLDEMFYTSRPTFSPDGKLLAVRFPYGMKTGQVRLRDAETGRPILTLDHGSRTHVTAFAFSTDSTRMAVAYYRYEQDRWKEIPGSTEVRVWDLRSQNVVGTIAPFEETIRQLAFSPGDHYLASVTIRRDPNNRKPTGAVKVWDAATWQEQQSFLGISMAFRPASTVMAVVDNDEAVALVDLETFQVLLTLPIRTGRTTVHFSPDGKKLCDGSAIWDMSDGRCVCELKGNTSPAQFSPDGRRLFSLRPRGIGRGFLQVWDTATGELVASIPMKADVGLSLHPDGWRCASASVPTGTWIVDARPLTAELRWKRDAQNLVAHLVREPLLKHEILDQLRTMKTISEPLRREALALAVDLENPSDILEIAGWEIVQYHDRSEDQYRRALRWLEESNRGTPNHGAVLGTLGLAQYRLGRFEDAITSLESAYRINISGYFSSPRRDLVCLAMAQHQLGRYEEARKTLVQSRDDENWGDVPPHLLHEAEALIEGTID